MSPQEFGSFFEDAPARFAVFSSYDFDPFHFERYLLGSTALAQARRIIVMVDANRFQKMMIEEKSPARSLNQRYLVLPVRRAGGVFHPKLALLLGENHADIICGSNNLTQSGSTHNLEILNRIPVQVDGESREIKNLPLVLESLRFFKECVSLGEARAQKIAGKWFSELPSEFPWLESMHKGTDGALELVHTLNGSLWDWLTRKIGSCRPRKIQIISPFFDSDLRLLKRLRERWPVCPVEITAQQNTSNLPANQLSRFGKAVRLFELPGVGNRRLHAKALAFTLEKQTLHIAGSANFTAAAFDGDNVETCLAWESDDDGLKLLFQDEFSRRAILPAEFEPGREQPPASEETPEPLLRIKSCVLDEHGRLSLSYAIKPELNPDTVAVALRHFNSRDLDFSAPIKNPSSGFGEISLPEAINAGFNGAVQCYLVAEKGNRQQVSTPAWLIQESRLTHEPVESSGHSGREAEIRETGRGLVEHLDEVGSQHGQAQLIQYLTNLNIHFKDDSGGRGGKPGFRVKIRDPFHPDTMPEWLKLSKAEFPNLAQAIYDFADRHKRHVLKKHERKGNINGLSNFMDVMVTTGKVLFVYLRRGVLKQHFVTQLLRDNLTIFTGRFAVEKEDETTGYLARIFENQSGSRGLMKKSFEGHNVEGHIEALLLIAQVVRGSPDATDITKARGQLAEFKNQVRLFENRIGIGTADKSSVLKALEDYEMLTEQELERWGELI